MPDFLASILAAKTPMSYGEFLAHIKSNSMYGITAPLDALEALSAQSIPEAYPKWQFEEPVAGDDKQLFKAEADYLRASYIKFIDSKIDFAGSAAVDYEVAREKLVKSWIKRGHDVTSAHDEMGLLESAIERLGKSYKEQSVVARTR